MSGTGHLLQQGERSRGTQPRNIGKRNRPKRKREEGREGIETDRERERKEERERKVKEK